MFTECFWVIPVLMLLLILLINITVYLMLLLLTVFRIKDMFKRI